MIPLSLGEGKANAFGSLRVLEPVLIESGHSVVRRESELVCLLNGTHLRAEVHLTGQYQLLKMKL